MGEWRQVRDGVWMIHLEPAGVNAGLVVGRDAVLLIDTGSSPEQGRLLGESVRALLGRPVTHVVITHWHFDHFFGLGGLDGVTSFGHESIMDHLTGPDPDVDPEAVRDQLGVDVATLAAPTETISLAKALDLGGRRVEIVYPGPGHSDGDLCVFVPDAHVVFTGDLVETSGDPAVGPDSVVEKWPQALEEVLEGGGHADDLLFVPGHGDPVDADFVADQRGGLAALWSGASDVVEDGWTLEDVVADFNGARTREWPFGPQSVVDALPYLFAELERGGVRRKQRLAISEV